MLALLFFIQAVPAPPPSSVGGGGSGGHTTSSHYAGSWEKFHKKDKKEPLWDKIEASMREQLAPLAKVFAEPTVLKPVETLQAFDFEDDDEEGLFLLGGF